MHWFMEENGLFFGINWTDLEKKYISKMGVNTGLLLRGCPSFLFGAW